MPAYRYRTEGVTGVIADAASPRPATNPLASSWGVVRTVGSPGTTRIPSPRPQSTRGAGVLTPAEGSTKPVDFPQPSTWSPDYILPSLYYTAPTPQTVPWESTNEIPLPAISTSQPLAPYSTIPTKTPATSAVVQRPRRIGGLLVQAWPRISQIWPTFGSGANNSANSGQIT